MTTVIKQIVIDRPISTFFLNVISSPTYWRTTNGSICPPDEAESDEDEGESVFSSDKRLSSGTRSRFASNLLLPLCHLTIMRSIVAALKGCGPFCM